MAIFATKQLAAAAANNIALSQSPGAGAIVLNGSTVVAGVAVLDTQRRVIFTSGGNDSGINFTLSGTDDSGQKIGEVIAGANAGAATSVLDYKTVNLPTHTGSVAGTLTIGTSSIGATPWFELHWPQSGPFNLEAAGIVAAGKTVNWGVQYTYDPPYGPPNLQPSAGIPAVPQPFSHPTLIGQVGSLDGPINNAIAAVRGIVNSGTDPVRFVFTQSGVLGV